MPKEVLEKMGGTPCDACHRATVPDGIDNIPCANPDCRRAGLNRNASRVATSHMPAFAFEYVNPDGPTAESIAITRRLWDRETWRRDKDTFWTWREVR